MKENKRSTIFNTKVAMFEISSTSLGFHNIPFFANSALEAVNVVRASVVRGKDGYLRDDLDDLSLICIGFYDTATGLIDTTGCPLIVTKLSDIPNIKAKEGDNT